MQVAVILQWRWYIHIASRLCHIIQGGYKINNALIRQTTELDTGLTSWDGHLSGESSSREINSSCEGNNLMESSN